MFLKQALAQEVNASRENILVLGISNSKGATIIWTYSSETQTLTKSSSVCQFKYYIELFLTVLDESC